MRCANCQNLWSEPTGHVLTPNTRLCGPCARAFKSFVRDQERRRLQRHRTRPSEGANLLLVAAAVLLALLSLSQWGCAADPGTPARVRLGIVESTCGAGAGTQGDWAEASLLDDGTIELAGRPFLKCASTGRSLECGLESSGAVPGHDAAVSSTMSGFLAWRQEGQLAGDVVQVRRCAGPACPQVAPSWADAACSVRLWVEVQLPAGETWVVLPEPRL